LHRQLPVFGRLAYPVRAEVTKRVLPGRKSLGCPVEKSAAVGTTWEVSKLGGLNIKKCLQSRKATSTRRRIRGMKREADPYLCMGKAVDTEEETGECTQWYRRDRGRSIRGKIRRDNVGKSPVAAGAGSNLQRLPIEAKAEERKSRWVRRMSPYEL